MFAMPMPFSDVIRLSDPQRAQLEALAFRCLLILRAAAEDHPCNLQIAAEFRCDRHTVAVWRNRYLMDGLAGLQDQPRSGRPRRFSPSVRLDVISLGSCTADQQG